MSETPSSRVARDGARQARLQQLREMLDRHRQHQRGGGRRVVPTGLTGLDEMLPRGGLPGGAVTEILSSLDGGGATTLALRAALAAAGDTGGVVVVDSRGDFYPPAFWRLGMAVDRLVVIRTSNLREALWAVDQALRCSAVAAVVAPVGRLEDATSRRLQLAAESRGGLALLLRPVTDQRHSFAAVQMRVEPVGVDEGGRPQAGHNRGCGAFSYARLCRVTLMKVREGRPLEPFIISMDDETVTEPLLSVPGDRPVVGHDRISA